MVCRGPKLSGHCIGHDQFSTLDHAQYLDQLVGPLDPLALAQFMLGEIDTFDRESSPRGIGGRDSAKSEVNIALPSSSM